MHPNVRSKQLGRASIPVVFMTAVDLLSIVNHGSVNSLATSMDADISPRGLS